MITYKPRDSKYCLNSTNSVYVGTPSQSTIATLGRSFNLNEAPRLGRNSLYTLSISVMNRSREGRVCSAYPRSSVHALSAGNSKKVSLRMSQYAIEAGDSALFSTKRQSLSDQNESKRAL